MKNIKRILSFVLVLVMVFALCAPALADSSYEPYRYYMCVGDSIAAGCGLTKDGSETYFDQDTDDTSYILDPDYLYHGFDFTAVPKAYHSLVANALDAKLLQYALSGMRAVEFRYFLEGVYNDFDTTYTWGNKWYDFDGSGSFTLSDLKYVTDQKDYTEAIKKTNLISINLGSNDVFSMSASLVLKEYTEDTENDYLKGIKDFLNKGGSIGEGFAKLLQYCQTAGELAKLGTMLAGYLTVAYNQFTVNYNAVIEKIYEINPDITVVALGVFNPFEHTKISDGSLISLRAVTAPTVTMINTYIRSFALKYDNFHYVNILGTETYDQNVTDKNFSAYFTVKAHPTIAGHSYMAEQILNALPERGTLPFTDVPADAWYYDELYYAWYNGLINGTSSTEFTPAAATTRAQAVTVLYRMAGSPNVSGLTEPFTDVPDDYWARDAIIWAYENAIISGYTATTFGPNDGLTRGQFVTIMHRYAGTPAASGDLGVFSDSSEIAGSYRNAVRWATANDIVNGYNDGTFRPNAVITRAQLAAILARFDKL